MSSDAPLTRSDVPGYPVKRGKVRDVYDVGGSLLIVATDRVSAFDWVLPTPIPGKGRILTEMSLFWFNLLARPTHFLSVDPVDFPRAFRTPELIGRSMLVRKAEVFPVECVARGYLAGSGWKEYRASRTVCGVSLPAGLRECEKLPQAIFTPATKAESGHDENIDFGRLIDIVGMTQAEELREQTLEIYRRAADHARQRGIIIADTKFEFGKLPNGRVVQVDEALTPDSSRFWPVEGYEAGKSQPSLDKQGVRDWLEASDWDKSSPPPELPPEVVRRTAEGYRRALEMLAGEEILTGGPFVFRGTFPKITIATERQGARSWPDLSKPS